MLNILWGLQNDDVVIETGFYFVVQLVLNSWTASISFLLGLQTSTTVHSSGIFSIVRIEKEILPEVILSSPLKISMTVSICHSVCCITN